MNSGDELSVLHKDMAVLVVDDEPSIVAMMQAVLTKYGYTHVHFARTGLEALRLLGIDHPQHPGRFDHLQPVHIDLAIIDIMLPDITGFEICLAIKNKVSPHLPVILMTGYPIEAHHARFVESGADDFLAKPFHPPELVARLGLHLARKHKLDQAARLQSTTQPLVIPPDGNEFHDAYVNQLIGDYRILAPISWSGASMIFKAEAVADQQPCVIKILTRQALEYHDVVQRFAQETRIMKSLRHPNLVRILDTGNHDGSPYYVMEYILGKDLEAIVAERTGLPFDLLVSVVTALASALAYIHSLGIVHRDVKPKNLFLLDDGTVKLGDFGIAIVLGDLRVTQEGYTIGTPIYMAPEQFDGGRIGPASDIYSFGATLYHLITGQPPFAAESAMEMLNKHRTISPRPIASLRPGVPEGWERLVVERCLAKRADERPADMTAILADLKTLAQQPF